MRAELILSILCSLTSLCFIANWLLAQIDVGDNKAEAWKSLLIGLVFAMLFWLELQSAGGK